MLTKQLTSLLAATALLAGCGMAGHDQQIGRYGGAQEDNLFTQIAYKDPSDRLRNLAIDFAAETTDTVTFAFDRANLDSTARAALKTQANWLKEHPDVRMTIIGHTDLVGTERYNDRLGLRRAQAALNYLVRQGIRRSRLDAIASRGESEPIVQTEDRERRNRRAVTTVAGFERNFVGNGMDGEVAQRLYNDYQIGDIDVTTADSTDTDG